MAIRSSRDQLPQTLADDPVGAFVLEVVAEPGNRWREDLVVDHPEAVVAVFRSEPRVRRRDLHHQHLVAARTYPARQLVRTPPAAAAPGGNESVTSSRFIGTS